ncbi:hypothetical protein ACQ4LE_009080 [Meloidogyne hapla]|uniref:Uncharacterized protein n=1 Tax=Meloidogyne hapla TaxID=6305 RepID=A0A1I8BTD8_MELHA
MSSFFNRQPELFDTTKKFGAGTSNGGGNNNNATSTSTTSVKKGSGSNLAAAGLAMMAEKPLAPDEIDSVPESWVELAPSRASLSSSIEAVNIGENSGGGIISQRDSRLSPVSIQSPAVELESSLEQVKYRLVKAMIGPDVGGNNNNKSSTEWLWDWANRSDGANEKTKNNQVINSTLTTPPNSPEPEETTDFFTFKSPGGKLYHRRVVSNKKLFDWSMFCRLDVLLAIVVSNLITGAVVYYCITRMENAQSASMDDPFAQTINKYFW